MTIFSQPDTAAVTIFRARCRRGVLTLIKSLAENGRPDPTALPYGTPLGTRSAAAIEYLPTT
ncbi:MAG: hypothetical protein HS126_00025 [Anaerolineales bacterium]|nr:hypothetical protein [Anaerolineales bacterium]